MSSHHPVSFPSLCQTSRSLCVRMPVSLSLGVATLNCSPDPMGRCQRLRFADWKDTSMRAIMLLQDSSVNPCVFRSLSGGMEKGEELLSDS